MSDGAKSLGKGLGKNKTKGRWEKASDIYSELAKWIRFSPFKNRLADTDLPQEQTYFVCSLQNSSLVFNDEK